MAEPEERIVLVESDAAWPQEFAREAARIRDAAGPRLLAIEHVGSTSVPGLVAKPIVDLLGGVASLADADALVPSIVALGYEYGRTYEDELPRRRYFRRVASGVRTHHLHVVEVGSWFWQDHLLFRDHLRRHPEDAAAYAQLKRELAARFAGDREAYTMSKTDFVRACVVRARRETSPPHALVAGGTGLLRGVVIGLAARGYAVSLVALNPRRLERLTEEAAAAGGIVRPICADARDAASFAFGIAEAIRDLGPPSLAVVWTHSSAPSSPLALAKLLDAGGHPAELFHVVGGIDPSPAETSVAAPIRQFARLSYHEIVLGRVPDGTSSRWLRDDEIAAGVLRAIDDHAARTVVGTESGPAE